MSPQSNTTQQTPAAEIMRGCLSGRIRMLSRAISALYDDALRPTGITTGQVTMLSFIDELEPIAPGALAERLKMEKSTMSRNVARMERNGWIAIESGDAGNSQVLTITRAGRSKLRAALPRWRAAQRQAKRILGPGGAAAVVDAFDHVRTHQANA